MPVKLEHIHQPTDDDLNDFRKIQSDTVNLGLNSETDIENWINDSRWVIAGRFNDRIVGALLAEKQSDNRLILTAPGVRSITQRRGVMHQMIHFLQRWSDENTLQLMAYKENCELSQALIKRDFVDNGDFLVYSPQ